MKVLDPAGISLRKQHKTANVLTVIREQITYGTLMRTINLGPLVCAFMEQLMDLVERSCG